MRICNRITRYFGKRTKNESGSAAIVEFMAMVIPATLVFMGILNFGSYLKEEQVTLQTDHFVVQYVDMTGTLPSEGQSGLQEMMNVNGVQVGDWSSICTISSGVNGTTPCMSGSTPLPPGTNFSVTVNLPTSTFFSGVLNLIGVNPPTSLQTTKYGQVFLHPITLNSQASQDWWNQN